MRCHFHCNCRRLLIVAIQCDRISLSVDDPQISGSSTDFKHLDDGLVVFVTIDFHRIVNLYVELPGVGIALAAVEDPFYTRT